jgi:hypothetical protein
LKNEPTQKEIDDWRQFKQWKNCQITPPEQEASMDLGKQRQHFFFISIKIGFLVS